MGRKVMIPKTGSFLRAALLIQKNNKNSFPCVIYKVDSQKPMIKTKTYPDQNDLTSFEQLNYFWTFIASFSFH